MTPHGGSPRRPEVAIEQLQASVFTIPTDRLESDGTLEWDRTTLIVLEISGGGRRGLGYTYAHEAAAQVASSTLAPAIRGLDALDVTASWNTMLRQVRNFGRAGIAASAISAVDSALWDLKARLLGLPLVSLLGAARDSVPVYGSGGFTSYSLRELEEQLGSWARSGFRRVKMKVGRDPQRDLLRVAAARRAIGPHTELFVDANGAHTAQRALAQAERFAESGVTWFEEPVSSDDLAGLRRVREGCPRGMEVAAGEYGYDPFYFEHMLDAGAVDVLQADATRCLGISGFLRAAALCEARSVPLSAHCAPGLHVHVGCAATPLRHIECFHDHMRIEPLFFEGWPKPQQGEVRPDLTRPGLGLELRRADAARYAA